MNKLSTIFFCFTIFLIGQVRAQTSSYSQYLAIIEGNFSVGSGFIANIKGKPLLVTNTHVLSGNSRITAKLINGQQVKITGLMVAELDSYDVSVLTQTTFTNGIDILTNLEASASIGDDVVVLGNSLGAGVITELPGKITGIGPQLIEVDAKFVSGNSGSPIIHLKTGQIIGIASFSTLRILNGHGKDSKFNSVERRFAWRLDNIPTWKAMDWGSFSREGILIANMEKKTKDAWNLAVDIARDGRITEWEQHTQVGNFYSTMVSGFQKEIAGNQTKKAGAQEYLSTKQRFIWSYCNSLKTDVSSIRPTSLICFHKSRFDEIMKDRDALRNYFDTIKNQLKNDPNFYTR